MDTRRPANLRALLAGFRSTADDPIMDMKTAQEVATKNGTRGGGVQVNLYSSIAYTTTAAASSSKQQQSMHHV